MNEELKKINARTQLLHAKLEALERRAESKYLGQEDAFNLSALIYDIDRFLESTENQGVPK